MSRFASINRFLLRHFHTVRFVLVVVCLAIICLQAMVTMQRNIQLVATTETHSTLPLPLPLNTATTDPMRPKFDVYDITVRKGHTLFEIMQQHDIDTSSIKLLAQSQYGHVLKYLQAGELMQLSVQNRRLMHLHYRPTAFRFYQYDRVDTQSLFTSKKVVEQPEISKGLVHFAIKNSLFESALLAGLPSPLIIDLTEIFAWDIDFAIDIRTGDQIVVIYEKLYKNGEFKQYGRISAAKIKSQGQEYYALRAPNGQSYEYYDVEGNNVKKAFLRNPLKYVDISSHFNPNRKHPILNTIRAHRGTDYRAKKGTPIHVTGDGKVVSAQWNSGYGNMVVVRHGQRYETRYAHLTRFGKGIRKGSRVKQNQVIGYVGKTGLATGYHLHYEFLIHGKHYNPMTVKLPRGKPIDPAKKQQFYEQNKVLITLLDQHSKSAGASHVAN